VPRSGENACADSWKNCQHPPPPSIEYICVDLPPPFEYFVAMPLVGGWSIGGEGGGGVLFHPLKARWAALVDAQITGQVDIFQTQSSLYKVYATHLIAIPALSCLLMLTVCQQT
jgi:hypothetical protein